MKNKLSLFLGILILFYGLLAIVYSIFSGEASWIFWMCYIGMILIGIGTITKNKTLIQSQLNILTIPLFFWTLDFTITLISGNSPFGTTAYFFELKPFAKIISLEHLFLVPLGITCLFLTNKQQKPQKNKNNTIIFLSIIQVIIVISLTLLLTPPSENVNCAFKSCFSFVPSNDFYLLYFFTIALICILIINTILNRLLSNNSNK